MDVALLTEGTYPHQFGGVSVWCDQLVRGLTDYDFHITALVATGTEKPVWTLPDNVFSVTCVPMWGAPPAGYRPAKRVSAEFRPLLTELVDVLTEPTAEGNDRFDKVIRGLAEYAPHGDLAGGLGSEEAVLLLAESWHDRYRRSPKDGRSPVEAKRSIADELRNLPVMPTLADAVTAMQLIEHSLRPLSHPPVRADVLHSVSNGMGALPALTAKWRYGTPMIVTEHGIYLREQYLHARSGPYRWPVKSLFLTFLRRLCALGYQEAEIITPGNVYNKRWEERLGADPNKIRTVYNGVDPSDFPPVVGEPDAPTVSWVGRVDPIKDLETLLHSFVIVHERMPTARLRMFGSSPKGREFYLERCKELAAELGIASVATFEGRVENIRDAYEAGHVVALCSVSEGFPYSVIEAMTCGRPCVATDVGGVTEAVGDTGIVVPPRNPEELAEACLALLQDDDRRHRLGAAARNRALSLFTVDRAISTFDEIYGFLGSGRKLPTAEPPVDADTADELFFGAAG